MVSSLGYARCASLCTFDPVSLYVTLREAKIAIYLYRKLEFAMLLLSLKTLLVFKMHSRFVFLFSFVVFFYIFKFCSKLFQGIEANISLFDDGHFTSTIYLPIL